MHDALDDTLSRIGALDADLVAPSLLHELRQPLMGADASARLLERAFGAALARDDEWRVLRAQLERLGEILLEYEGLLRATDEAPSRYAVGPVVARSVALLAHRVRPLARRFGLAREEGDCEGFGDPGALVHAATNVLAKALGRGTGLGLHLSRRLMARHGGGVFLVPERDPARLAWAVTEFCIAVPPP